MANTTTQSVGQQYWSNQYNALKNSLDQARLAVREIQKIYGIDPQAASGPSLTSEQQRRLEQAYLNHLQAGVAVTSFVNDTQGQMLRMSVTADAIASDVTRNLSEREYARQTSATLQQRTIEFLQVKSSENWQVPSSLQYTVDHKILVTSATGIVERGTDTSTTTGKVIATFDTVKNLLSTSLADGAQTVQQLRDIGLKLPNDYELCVAIMGIPTGRVIKEILPMPDSFKSWPTMPFPLQMPWDTKTIGEKLYKDGVKSVIKSITAEEEFCKIHLDKSDVKDLLRKYGLADDALFDRMDLLGVDEIAFNVSREFFNQALATQAALSSLTETLGLTAAVFDQQVQQATAGLSSSATLMATYARQLEAAGLEALDGAEFGADRFSVTNDQLYLHTSAGSHDVVVLASLEFNGKTLGDAGPGEALQLIQIQTINGQPGSSLVNAALQDADINAHDILLGRGTREIAHLVIAAEFGKILNGTETNLVKLTTTTGDFARVDRTTDATSTGPSGTGNNLVAKSDYTVGANYALLGDVNIVRGNAAVANYATTDGFRPGNDNLGLNINASTGMGLYVPGFNPGNTDPVAGPVDYSLFGSSLNNAAFGNFNQIPVDPLVLDIDGSGVSLTNYATSPVLFDADNDRNAAGQRTKEQTGWMAAGEGMVVHDLNGNSVIDGVDETLSEYYGGVAGSNGSGDAGSKRFANGFAALKSLDSNADNQFTAADAAWSQLRVWVDANHDGKTDAGELKTFSQLGITAINLASNSQSGEVRDGNEVLARGTFTQTVNGVSTSKEAIAANFLVNPAGSTVTQSGSGVIVATESVGSSAGNTGVITAFVSQNTLSTVNETLNAVTLNVRNVTGGAGADMLTGDAQANWLAGGLGADSFSAGAGDDVLLIDAADTHVDGGEGLDVAQVIGSQGVTLNLAQSNIEIAVGGNGNDVLIGGGRSTVFVRGGAGNDVIVGGAANDVLSGEDGDDLIDGGAGNDLMRGHKGQDQLLGGAGDDVLDGGLEDDQLTGGAGNDVLTGGRGDDVLDGGDGVDVAEYSGSYADYRITKIRDTASGDTTFRVVDTRTGQDGADTLTGIEKLSFSDVSRVELTLGTPMPVKDILSVNSSGAALSRTATHLLSKNQLLQNDRDWDSDISQLRITEVLEAKGGTASLTAQGDVLFTPDANYTGVMSFKYKVQDAQGNASQVISATGQTEPMKAAVYLQTTDLPADPLAVEQWYLSDTNVFAAWGTTAEQAKGQGYSGKGIKIGQFEPGGQFSVGPEVFDYRHPDLAQNADKAWLNALDASGNSNTPQTFSDHATMVAGVMVAARNNEGGVGIAYNASLAGNYIQGEGLEVTQLNQEITSALAKFKNYDVVNNSWGSSQSFGLNVVPLGVLETGMLNAVTSGRNGLGTAIVMAGGNDREHGVNTNYNALTANRAVITVGSINAPGDLGSLQMGSKPFSNPGASILVSAPGSNIDSTNRELMSDNGSTFGSQYSTSQGTSFAAPIVSGIIALMLEANPGLGYRDIQTILAMSATKVDDPNGTDWTYNAASNWNGGGMHASHDYGFGKVDARAAVRLAESWTEQNTAASEFSATASTLLVNTVIPDGGMVTRTLSMAAGLEVESAQVTLELNHQRWGDLIVKLISPGGTESILVNRPGKAPGSAASDGGDTSAGALNFSFNSTHLLGEQSGGVWTLQVIDAATGSVGTLQNWKLDLYGKTADTNDVYVYTNEFASFTGTMRNALTDGNGGRDTLNASAVTGNSTINLNNGSSSILAGKTLTVSGDIEIAFGGDGNDILTGNALDNVLLGGRGADVIDGGAGDDTLDSGRGNDVLTGGAGNDLFVIGKDANSQDTIMDLGVGASASVVESIALVGFGNLSFATLSRTQVGADTRLDLGEGQSVVLRNQQVAQLTAAQFQFFSSQAALQAWQLAGKSRSNTAGPGATGGDDVMQGTAGDDLLNGLAGNDTLSGLAGNDTLFGGSGLDALDGGAGNDLLVLDGDQGGVSYSTGLAGTGARIGGSGADRFLVAPDGGGALTVGLSGSNMTTSNLVLDFDPAVDKIDLSQFSWVAGFAQLAISKALNINGKFITRVSVQSANQPTVAVGLYAVEPAALTAANFIFFGSPDATPMPVSALSSSMVAGAPLLALFSATEARATMQPGAVDGTASNDTLVGDAGANTLNGLGGADAMTGRTGDDNYIVDNADDTVSELPGGGYDSVQSSVNYALGVNVEALTLTGTANLNATGNSERNRLVGNAGNNRLDGGAEADNMIGGAGNDLYVVDTQLDTLFENANAGIDTVESSVSWTLGSNFENLTLTGTANANATGNELANVLTGSAGDNTLDGAQGADTMVGGAGNDTFYVDNASDQIIEGLYGGIDTVYTNVNLTLANNVENATLFGTATVLTGNALDNTLLGGTLADSLNGGAGDDVIDGGAGSDVMAGGANDDTYFVDHISDSVVESTGQGLDTVVSSLSYTLGDNAENLILTGIAALNGTGNALENCLNGNTGNNMLGGGTGDDTLDGGAGNDTLKGGLGNDEYVIDSVLDVVTELANEGTDTLQSYLADTALGANIENLTLLGALNASGTGNSLSNTITGNAGDNVLDGGAGADTLSGGGGNDRYRFNLGGGRDTIVETGGNDRIVFGSGISAAQITANMLNGQVTLSVTSGDSISFTAPVINNYAVDQFEFADGSVKDAAWLNGLLNIAPTGANKTLTLDEDGSYAVTATDLGFSDANAGDSLSAVRIDSLPGAGSLKLNGTAVTAAQVISATDLAAGRLVFSPVANANGNNYASLSFSVKDLYGAFDTAPNISSFNVTAVNDAPTLTVFMAAVTTVGEDSEAPITLAQLLAQGNEADIDGTVSAFVIKAVSSGSLRLGATAATATAWNAAGNNTVDVTRNAYWRPAANANGTLNALTAVAKDNGGAESSVAVQAQMVVTPVNDAPALTGANAVLGAGAEDTAYTITQTSLLTGFSDVDGNALSVVNLNASNGSLSVFNGASGSWTFTPNANYNGVINLAYGVSDGAATTSATQSLTLAAVNDAPMLTAFAAPLTTSAEDNEAQITLAQLMAQGNEADIDGTVGAFVIKTVTTGSLRIGATAATATPWGAANNTVDATRNAYWTPAANANGKLNAFMAVARDNGAAESATAIQAQVTVTAVNDAPALTSAKAALSAGNEDTAYTITQASLLAGFSDAEGNSLSIVNLSANNGSLSAFNAATGAWTFTPNANYNGVVNLSYGVSDGTLSTLAAQSFALASVNDAPTLTSLGAAVQYMSEDAEAPITLTHLQNAGNEADIDGTVSAFVIKSVSSGNLRIGATAASATAWNALGNNTVDGSHIAYWTPAANANGMLNAFMAVARDNNGAESATAIQAKVSVTPVNDAPTGWVTISGNAVQYQTLTASGALADADGFSEMSARLGIGYDWLINGNVTRSGTTLVLSQDMVGKTISLRAQYIDSTNRHEWVDSAAVVVANVNDAPTGTVRILRGGTAVTAGTALNRGDVLSAISTLADLDGMGLISYQWLANGTVIAGATAASLTLTQALLGKTLSVKASYIDGFGTAEAVISAATGAVTNGAPTGAVSLWRSGAAITANTAVQAGDILTATNTLASSYGLGTLTYQWQSSTDGINWNAISGATSSSMTLGPALSGQSVRMAVGYTDSFGTAQSVSAAAAVAVNRVVGTAGADTLIGTAGADLLLGRAGDDSYTVNNAGDMVQEASNDGTDTVTSSMDHTLRACIENLILTGAALNGTGNGLANTVTGNSGNNLLMGGFGADTLIGGSGDDVLDGSTEGYSEIVYATVTSDTSAVYTPYAGTPLSVMLTDGVLPCVAAGQFLVLEGGIGESKKIYVTPGSHVDLGGLSINAGSLYLSGNFSDYSQSLDQSTGVYTFSRNLPEGQSESAAVKVSSMGNPRLYFADGSIVLNCDTETRLVAADTYMNFYMNPYGSSYANSYMNPYGNPYAEIPVYQAIQQDWLAGGAQAWPADIPLISQGADRLVGGLGNDDYFVDDAGDVVVESVAEGTDTVKSRVSHTLAANVENLTLTGTAAIKGTGNALDNILIGNDAANTLDGGTGADTLSGGKGNDNYAFSLGDGADIIQENDITTDNTDTLSFASGIANNQLWFSHTGNDLAIGIIGTADNMTVQNWYLGDEYHVEQIKVSDGKVLLNTQVEALVQAMAGFTPPAMGQTALTATQKTALAPVLAANWH